MIIGWINVNTANAQTRTVKGMVVDDSTFAPVEGATISLAGTPQMTTSNASGQFVLTLTGSGREVEFTHVSYESGKMIVPDTDTMRILMTKLSSGMDEIVVVGYGTQRRNEITGSVATIKGSEIQDIPATNIAAALRGRIAGLGVSAVSGRPGAGISLNVRNSAISDAARGLGATTEPLYVVDNIIVTKAVFDALDPSMVEDISILKDAAAAVYGASGAKGVILITTKRGKAGPPQLSYNGYMGISDATRKPKSLSAYEHAKLLNDGFRLANRPPGDFFSDADLEYLKNVNYPDWFDQVWQPSLTQRHNLGVTGGSDRMTFALGGAYQNENGNFADMKADRYTFRGSVTAKLISGFRMEVNFNVDNGQTYSANGMDERGGVASLWQTPKWVPYSIDGKWVNFGGHPQAQIESGQYKDERRRGYNINASLVYQPEQGFLKGLTARFQASQMGSNSKNDEFRPRYSTYNFHRIGNNAQLFSDSLIAEVIQNQGNNSRLMYSMNEARSYQLTGSLQYARKFGQHSLNIVAAAEQRAGKNSGMGTYWMNQQIPNFDFYWAFDQTPITNNPTIGESFKRSFIGRFSYNFAGKYMLDGVARMDASSNFAANNIWGVFPTIGAGWIVSSEPFFKNNVSFINYLKLRINYGTAGEDRIDSRLWQERFRINPGSYLYGDLAPGLRPVIIPNPDITWEKKRTVNGGVEMAFLKNRLNLGVDVFQSKSYDAYDKGNDQNFPMYAGFQAPVLNYQVRYNWGTEVSIGYNAPIGKEGRVTVSTNFGFGNSVVDQVFYNRYLLWENQAPDWQIGFGTDPRKYNNGNFGLIALGMFKSQDEVDAFMSKNPGYTINGQVPQPGWLYYKDADGDGIITDRDKTPMFNRIDPILVTGLQLGFSYKSFDWRVNIGANIGGKVFDDSQARRSNATVTTNVPAFWADRWTPDNPNGRFPRFDDPSMTAGWESTFWAHDGTMIRINDMTLAYTVPPNLVRKIGLSSARVMLTGNNLWVIKNPLSYMDPYNNWIYDYPLLRTISAGLSLGL